MLHRRWSSRLLRLSPRSFVAQVVALVAVARRRRMLRRRWSSRLSRSFDALVVVGGYFAFVIATSIFYGEDEAKLGRHHFQVRDVTIDVEFRAMVFS